jgi:excisionase family DNA binding protein
MLTDTPCLTYSIDELMRALKLSRQVVYDEINAGRLKTYKVGRRRFASAEALRAWVRQRETEHGR